MPTKKKTSRPSSARKKPTGKKSTGTRSAGKKPARAAAKKAARAAKTTVASSTPPRHVPTPGVYGWITHTDLASADPAATRAWCAAVLGWTFKPAFPGLEHVHLFVYSDKGGGAVRPISPPEIPGSIPYIHVEDVPAAFDTALREGAVEMLSPTKVMDGVVVAIVRAPGGVPVGFSGER